MGDGEAMIADRSAVMGHATAGYSSDYTDNNTNVSVDAGVSKEGFFGDMASLNAASTGGSLIDSTVTSVTDHAMANGSNSTADNAYNHDMDSFKGADQPMMLAHDSNEKFAGIGNMSVDAFEVGYHDHSSNGNNDAIANRTAVDGVNGNENPSNDVQRSFSEHQLVDGSALSAEEERLWNILRANSLDFNAWTALITETEQSNDIVKIRKVYDAFLAEFPLCYGYWKKYADHEARLGSIDKVVEVYEGAIQGVTYSVDMWMHYCDFAINTYGDPDTVRRLFERGLAYVDSDYLSFALWDKYIEYEYTQQQWSHLAVIYTRILENPNSQLDRYFNSFKELVATHPLSELRTAEEAAATSERSEMVCQETEGEVLPDAMEQPTKPLSAELVEAEELEKYITIREELYKKAKEFDSKIIGFETAIKRPYFHVLPLNVAELENWHHYLDFIESGGDFNKIVKLYERCLIACANYHEYWIRYLLCSESSGSADLADNALARATQVFVKRQPEIHLFAARFWEQRDDVIRARASYQLVHAEISPGLLEAVIKHANMEHRLGNLEDACSLYEQAIAIEKGKEQSQTLPFLFAQYSRFLSMVVSKMEKAREVLDEALENFQLSKPLLEALIHLESVLPLPKRVDYLDSLVEKFIIGNPDNPSAANFSEREELSSIFLEFLDLFGDTKSIKKADDRHAKLFLRHMTTSESKKRLADDFLDSDKNKLARSSVNTSSSQVMGAHPSAQQQWPAGYGLQPQAWPQVTQSQGQWTSGYAQQAVYGAYGTYGSSYTNAQVQPSVSPTAAYGAYPPTYPSQAFPRQSYPHSSTSAATLNPPQQPTTSVPPQAYYGSYY